jgi:hypothetical protein
MRNLLSTVSSLLEIARGHAPEDLGPAQRTRMILRAGLASLVFAACWGLAAGSAVPSLAVANAIKVPMVVLFSALSAVPAGLLALRLSSSPQRASELLLSFAAAVFSGTLVAAVLAPIVAIYYQTSIVAGPYLGIGSALGASAIATLLFFRSALRTGDAKAHGERIIPFIVLAVVMFVTMPQLIALASPILPENTVFDSGIDTVTAW